MRVKVDHTGLRTGMLTVIGYSHTNGRHHYWTCLCECGGTTVLASSHLHRPSLSCGCRDYHKTKHGGSYWPEYDIWKRMKNRCLNPNDTKYHHYGGRGIKVCQQWMKFASFIKDMGRRPAGSIRYTLERKNNDGNYEPLNCKWATYSEQNFNRRNLRARSCL